jgi:hypothetical protein
MNKTYITLQKLNNNDIVGNSPTVTFNENVTVYIYPRINCIDSNEMFDIKSESVDIRNEPIDTSDRYHNKNKIFAFFKKCIKKTSI